ncbi:MAG: amidohydrolase family protein [Bryobacterales bacterium]|nr:amidohydrolase family protein [Bryobacterales bacterium]
MRIDSHQHFWKTSRGDYHWMSPEVPVLCRDYLPEDLRPILSRCGIGRTVVVQAAQTTAETDFLLDLAASCDFIAGVVGWLDMEDASFAAQFERYRRNPRFIGLRPMLQDLDDDAWILRPAVIESLRLVADAGFPFDFLTYTRHLPHVLRALELAPGLRAVIDHISKPEIRAGIMEPWKTLVAEMARHPNVCCKLSGMITEADHRNWTAEDLRPYIEHVVEQFGWERVMFGSDWPVCRLAGDYGQVLAALQGILAPRMDEGREAAVFGGNAGRFYRIQGAAA